MGNHKYEEYVEVPPVWRFAEVVADPNIMASVTFPGRILGTYGEWALRRARAQVAPLAQHPERR